jgi:hypothetical protein
MDQCNGSIGYGITDTDVSLLCVNKVSNASVADSECHQHQTFPTPTLTEESFHALWIGFDEHSALIPRSRGRTCLKRLDVKEGAHEASRPTVAAPYHPVLSRASSAAGLNVLKTKINTKDD